MKKRTFEDYEELALIVRTVDQLLSWSCFVYNRAAFTDKITRLRNKLDILKSQLEDALFNDYPEEATTEMFYGGREYSLEIRKHKDCIYSAFAKKTCNENDAFIILTKQGVVLASDDTRLTPEEDRYLYQLNQELISRKAGE